MKALQLYDKRKQVVQEKTESIAQIENGVAVVKQKPYYEEKKLEINYWDGKATQTIYVGNLAEVYNGQTREQRILQSIMEQDGHLLISELDNLILRSKNIISCKAVWKRIKNENTQTN